MAFSSAGWSAMGGQSMRGSVPALYCYTTADLHTEVDGVNYFNALSDTLAVGDMIIVHGNTGVTRTITMHVVVSNASGVVDVSDGTVIAVVTDTD